LLHHINFGSIKYSTKSVHLVALLLTSIVLGLFTSVSYSQVTLAQSEKTKTTSAAILFFGLSESMRDMFGTKLKVNALADLLQQKINADIGSIKVTSFVQNGKENCKKSSVFLQTELKQFAKNRDQLIRKKPEGKLAAAHLLEKVVRINANKDHLNLVYFAADQDICNIDVCATAKLLKKQGYQFSVNVVSLGVPLENQKSLQCLAKTTGGLFLHAQTAQQLSKVYVNVIDKISARQKDKISQVKIESLKKITAGEKFKVRWHGPNNKHDRVVLSSFDNQFYYTYAYVNSKSSDKSTIELNAPDKAGKYRIHYMTGIDNISLYSQYIQVEESKAYLHALGAVIAGSKFEVSWRGPRKKYDQIRIYDPKKPSKQYSYTFTRLCSSNKADLIAPDLPGQYEIRYMAGEKTLAKIPLLVKRSEVELAFKSEIMAGSTLYIKWKGPNNQFDKLRLVGEKANKVYLGTYVSMADDKVIKLPIRVKLGRYRVEYLNSNNNVLASKVINVIQAKAQLKPVDPVVAGGKVRVHWQGPINEYDVVKIIDPKQLEKKFASTFVKFHRIGHTRLNVPEKAGQYEIVYFSQSKKVLARISLQVLKANASISPIVKKIRAGANFEVSWKGPDNQYDMIRIRKLTKESKPLAFIYVHMHRSHRARMIAPRQIGLYEIEYLTSSKQVLARTRLQVE